MMKAKKGAEKTMIEVESSTWVNAALAAGDDNTVPRLMGTGHLAFTVDQGPDSERYQGIVALEGATLSDCAHNYFRQSEQIAAAIQLAADRVGGGASGRALR